MSDYIMDMRRLVGKRPLLQVGASVICVNEAGELLLQRRQDNGCWAYPGGSVELDEPVEDAARRELAEEMGLRAGALTLWNVFSGPERHYVYPNGDEVSCVDIVYICRQWTGEVLPQASEVSDWAWFAPDALPQPLSPPVAQIIRDFAQEMLKSKEATHG